MNPIVFELVESDPCFNLTLQRPETLCDAVLIGGLDGWFMRIVEVTERLGLDPAPSVERRYEGPPWVRLRPYAPFAWIRFLSHPAYRTLARDATEWDDHPFSRDPRELEDIEVITTWATLADRSRFRVVDSVEAALLLDGELFRDTVLSTKRVFQEAVRAQAAFLVARDRERVSDVLNIADTTIEARLDELLADEGRLSTLIAGNVNTLGESLRRYFFAATKGMKQEILGELRQGALPGGDDVH